MVYPVDFFTNDAKGIRTPDLAFRKRLLYPAELWHLVNLIEPHNPLICPYTVTNSLLKWELTIFILAPNLMIEQHHFLLRFGGLEIVNSMKYKMKISQTDRIQRLSWWVGLWWNGVVIVAILGNRIECELAGVWNVFLTPALKLQRCKTKACTGALI